MADHVISLNARQESAAQAIVDQMNAQMIGASTPITVDDWLKSYVLAPIRNKIQEIKAQTTAAVSDAYDAAPKATQDQVKTILGIV